MGEVQTFQKIGNSSVEKSKGLCEAAEFTSARVSQSCTALVSSSVNGVAEDSLVPRIVLRGEAQLPQQCQHSGRTGEPLRTCEATEVTAVFLSSDRPLLQEFLLKSVEECFLPCQMREI